MNIALEAGGLDLYKRAKHLSGTQAKELVATKQGDKIKSEFDELEKEGDIQDREPDSISEESEEEEEMELEHTDMLV